VKDQASTTTLFGCVGTYNVHFTPVYKGVNTWRTTGLYNIFESAKTLSNCSASKSSLRISVFKFISL